MTKKYEQRYLIDLAFQVAHGFSPHSVVAQELSSWVEDHDLGFAWDPEMDSFRKKGVPTAIWSDLRKLLADRHASVARSKPDMLAENISLLAAHVGLTADERIIFELGVRTGRSGPAKSLCDALVDDARIPVQDAVIHLTGLPTPSVRRALAPTGRLLVSGLLQFDKPPLSGLGLFPSDRLLVALDPPSQSLSDILGKLFARVGAASVAWEDFEHLGAGCDFAFRLLRGALERQKKGLNILLHGVPGTGKTEFCKALAQRLGASLHAVGEADDDGDEPSRFERLQQLRLGQRLLSEQGNSLILFDEMQDLFPGLKMGSLVFQCAAPGRRSTSTGFWKTTRSRPYGRRMISATVTRHSCDGFRSRWNCGRHRFLCAAASGKNWPRTTKCRCLKSSASNLLIAWRMRPHLQTAHCVRHGLRAAGQMT